MEYLRKYFQHSLGCLLIASILCLLAQKDIAYSGTQKAKFSDTCQKIKIWTIAKLEWNKPLKLNLAWQYPDSPQTPLAINLSDLPGPKTYPLRPGFVPVWSPGGLAGIVEDGNGRTQPLVILLNRTITPISLPDTPYGVSRNSDGGAWVLFGKTLTRYDVQGKVLQTTDNPGGSHLIGAERDTSWILSLDQAWFVSAEGKSRGGWQWQGWTSSTVIGRSLCGWDRKLEWRRLRCLEPDGREHFMALNWLIKPKGGQILSVTKDTLLTRGSWIFSYNDTGRSEELKIENVGLTTTGEAFVSILTDDNQADVCLSNGKSYSLPAKYTNPSFSFPYNPRMSVIAVEGEKILTYGFDRAIWYKDSRVEKSFEVNDQTYQNSVFPHLWKSVDFAPTTVNRRDRTIILSSSGPNGIALIGVRWSP